LGYKYFRDRLHKAFWSQKDLQDEAKIRQGVKRAEFVKKEIEALYEPTTFAVVLLTDPVTI